MTEEEGPQHEGQPRLALGPKDAAKALGIKFGTLRTTLHFARKRLATALRQMEKST